MDAKKGVYATLLEALDELPDELKSSFYFYDLAEPEKLVYHFQCDER